MAGRGTKDADLSGETIIKGKLVGHRETQEMFFLFHRNALRERREVLRGQSWYTENSTRPRMLLTSLKNMPKEGEHLGVQGGQWLGVAEAKL